MEQKQVPETIGDVRRTKALALAALLGYPDAHERINVHPVERENAIARRNAGVANDWHRHDGVTGVVDHDRWREDECSRGLEAPGLLAWHGHVRMSVPEAGDERGEANPELGS